MTTIPENVASLKRQELQRLCKAHKIKANMKNTEMIQALQERRQQMLVEEEDKTDERADVAEEEMEDKMASKVKSKSVMEKKTAMEDKVSSEKKTAENRAVIEDKAIVEVDSTTVEEEKCTMKDEIEEETSAIECEEEKHMKPMEDKVVRMEEGENDMKTEDEAEITEDTVMVEVETADKLVAEEDMSGVEDGTERDQDADTVMDTEEDRTEQADETEDKHMKEEEATMETEGAKQHELILEDSNGNTTLSLAAAAAAVEGDDILNTTYTIEPPEQLVDDPDDALSTSLLNPSCDSPSTLPQGAWALGPALRDSPLLRAHQVEKENTSKSAHDNIMALLNARVEERKQEPGYCPKEAADGAGPASRIPVRSETTQRFDNAHKKHFNQMTSIKDELENRKRRRTNTSMSTTTSQNPTITRRPLHEPPLRKKPKSEPQASTVKKTLANKHSKTVTRTAQSKQSAGRPSTHKTPKMPLTQSQKTPHLLSSKKHTLGYTPKKGPLPKYEDTVSKNK